jgi:hypothetical protein
MMGAEEPIDVEATESGEPQAGGQGQIAHDPSAASMAQGVNRAAAGPVPAGMMA